MAVYSKRGEKREEIKTRLEKAGVQFLWTQFVDIHGAAKVKQVHSSASTTSLMTVQDLRVVQSGG